MNILYVGVMQSAAVLWVKFLGLLLGRPTCGLTYLQSVGHAFHEQQRQTCCPDPALAYGCGLTL